MQLLQILCLLDLRLEKGRRKEDGRGKKEREREREKKERNREREREKERKKERIFMAETNCLKYAFKKLLTNSIGEIPITSDTQMTPPLWQKVKKS